DPAMCFRTALAFVSFCLVSSAIYAINDVCDRTEDRRHPVKKNRPIASGAVGASLALLFSGILIVLGLLLAGCINRLLLLVVLLYIVIHIAYSLKLKHIVILDVMMIAGGFVLRILGGSVAIAVSPSHWLVLCTVMISMFLGFTKRRAELIALDTNSEYTRLVLRDYSTAFLDQVISIVTAATIVCYTLYTVDAHTLEVLGNRGMLLTVPSVMYGLFRYIYLIYHRKKGQDPTDTLIYDIPIICNLIVWLILSLLVVNYGSQLYLFR
ncbi:MAG: decaprenyl-phosphate phosphoribosyltransferase, partial [Sedimentisphaerales bacterium]|nr:decaprenyl-phosphate phosphoribosyltransferase [Sedimentisphaerales bacterium]